MRQMIASARRQAWRLRFVIALVVVPTLATLALVTLAAALANVEVRRLTADPLEIAGAHPLVGFTSNLGSLLWSASAGACVVAALVLWRERRPGDGTAFFAWSAALTALLVVDDMFQVHEGLVPGLLGRGQTWVILGYCAITAAYVWRFRRTLLATDWVLLGAAGVWFAISIGVDFLPLLGLVLSGDVLSVEERSLAGAALRLLEDGSKLMGIAFWLAFFLRAAGDAIQSRGGATAEGSSAGDGASRAS